MTGRSADIFAIRDDITRSIAGTLGKYARRSGSRRGPTCTRKKPKQLHGLRLRNERLDDMPITNSTREDNAAAREFFEKARKIDPKYARAYAGLAWTYEIGLSTSSGPTMTRSLLDLHLRTPARQCSLIPMISKPNGDWGGHIFTLGNLIMRWPHYLRTRKDEPKRRRGSRRDGQFAYLPGPAETSHRPSEVGYSLV